MMKICWMAVANFLENDTNIDIAEENVVCLGLNSSPTGQNGCHYADDIFRCNFVNEKFCILIEISLKFVPKGPIDNNPALV